MKSGKRIQRNGNNILPLAGLAVLAAVICSLTVLGFRATTPVVASRTAALSPEVALAGISLPFVPNDGQWDSRLRFRADLFSGALAVTDQELIYSLASFDRGETGGQIEEADIPAAGSDRIQILIFKEKFLTPDGQEISLSPAGRMITGTRVSYFHGQDADSWRRELPGYRYLSLGRLYPGIQIDLKASGKNVEKIFTLEKGARVNDIRIRIEGVEIRGFSEEGGLLLESNPGRLEMVRPVGFQEIAGQRKYVEIEYEIKSRDQYGFRICGPYDPDYPLVIDPALSTLSAATFIGGTGNDRGFCIGLNNEGQVYVAGYTLSIFQSDFPTTSGAFDTSANGSYDIFISRLDNSLTQLEASTYLGGKNADYVYGMSITEDGHIFLTGITSSRDFPVTAGAFQTQYQGGEYDAFVVKMSPDLNLLLGSTYLGGRGIDYGSALSVIPLSYNNDTVVVVGMTDSPDFPVTEGAYSTTLNGNQDAFVAVLYNGLSSLDAATFIGGSDYDIASSVAVDGLGNFWVAGRTRSSDFPVTPQAFDLTHNGDYDGFVLHINQALNVIYSSTYIGGSGADHLYSIAVYGEDLDVYVAGYTSSSDFPVTEGAYRTFISGPTDIFITKFPSSLSYIIGSTFLGGSSEERCRALVVDANGNPYIAGWTKSINYPATAFSHDTSYNGGWDAMVTKLSAKLRAVLASTFLGGSADDLAYGLALDGEGNVYVTGYTQSSSFPVTEDAYNKKISGTDVFAARFAAVDSYQLTVSRSGEGSGMVSSLDGGIDCGIDCAELYDEGFTVILTATPGEGSVFGGWTGDVISPDNPLGIKMDADKNITAKFSPAEATYTLTVIKSGPGNGTVTSEDEEINCGDVCSASYPAGTLVKLTATPDEFSGFDSWTGDISGTTKTISFLMDEDKTVVAVFGPSPLPDLTGEWIDLKASRFLSRTIVLSGFLKLINDGDGELKGSYKASFYLSADGQSLDTILETRALGFTLAPDGTRVVTCAWYLSQNLDPVGKYLIAVLDSENQVEEKDEDNNLVVYGPIGASNGNETRIQERKIELKKISEAIKNKIGK